MNKHARVIAGPGSGKTMVLLERVKYLLKNGVQPDSILVLAFNRKIKISFEEKLKSQAFEGNDIQRLPNIMTINAWGWSLNYEIRRNVALNRTFVTPDSITKPDELSRFVRGVVSQGAYLKRTLKTSKYIGGNNIELELYPEEVLAISGVEDVLDRLRKRVGSNAINWKNNTEKPVFTNDHQLIEAIIYVLTGYRNLMGVAQDMVYKRPREYPREIWDDVVRLACLIDDYLIENNIWLFEDQTYRIAKFISGNNKARDYLQNRYQYILVDEYQDVNETSQFLITTACQFNTQLNAVGDPRQAIFEFAGADARYLTHGLAAQFNDISNYFLSHSFRFGKEIASISNRIGDALLKHTAYSPDDDLDFFLEDATDMESASIIGVGQQGQARITQNDQHVAEVTKEYLKAKKSVVYVVRTHEAKMQVESFLTKNNIYFKHSVNLHKGAMALIFDSMHFILDAWSTEYIDLQDQPSFWRHSRGLIVNNAARAADNKCNRADIEGFIRSFMLQSKLEAITPSKTVLELYETIYEEIVTEAVRQIPRPNHESKSGGELEERLLTREEKVAYSDFVMSKIVRPIRDRYGQQLAALAIDEAEYVQVEVAHTIKGLEFDLVVVFDAAKGSFPFARKRGAVNDVGSPISLEDPVYLAQERRLFFVAATRAKEHLIFYIPKGREKSQFLMS